MDDLPLCFQSAARFGQHNQRPVVVLEDVYIRKISFVKTFSDFVSVRHTSPLLSLSPCVCVGGVGSCAVIVATTTGQLSHVAVIVETKKSTFTSYSTSFFRSFRLECSDMGRYKK